MSSQLLPYTNISSLISRLSLLVMLMILLPRSCYGVTFYFGAEKSPLEQHNFESLAEKPNLSNDELKSVYSFCNLLPLLQATGRMNMDKRSSETCTQLMKILKPIFDKRTAKRSLQVDDEEEAPQDLPLHRIRTPMTRKLSRTFLNVL
ncbi:unnamed protein product [Bursaphelenchus okinawaensis]|uniref:Uncharacterized protein n=1 Tax=Bursaphelenchus okinawaensis TaxID=465554 RepID=A0A811KVQ2_9BILA|nr:unnamed protein product [Bursaphelenchus okinawaensis]CAG9113017.1 unnamed protein product [Bursaphelenchus okinawaensis]